MIQDKPYNDRIKNETKRAVLECITEKPEALLNVHKKNSIDALVSAVEALIKN